MINCDGLRKGERRIGIYCVFNILNGRKYIGSSNNLWRRFTEHQRHLFKGHHRNKFLQSDFNQLLSTSFLFFVVEECNDEERIAVEQKWLDALYDGVVNCYNIEKEAGTRRTWVPSAETRHRMSLAKLGKPTGPCSESRRLAIREAKLGKPINHSIEGKRRMIESKQKTYDVKFINPNGLIFGPITNLHAFCRDHNLDRASVLRVIKGKQGRIGQWKLLKFVGEDYKTRKRKG